MDSDDIDLNEFIALPKTKKPESEDIYKANLAALEKNHPELVKVIESASVDEDRIKVFYSESGNPRISFKKYDGEEVFIHSADDPVSCANQAIDLLGKIEKEGIIVLFGFGLGYFAEEVFKKFEKGHLLFIYEAMPDIFKTALQIRDFSKLFESDRVKIILGENADNFSVIHSHHHLIANGKFWVVQHKPSVKLSEAAYDRFFKRLDEEKRLSDTGVATVVSRGKEFIDAFLLNAHSVIRKPGVIGLKDIFKGRPAIVVSAGPSLDNNIHLLKKAKGKAIIVATGGALPTLLLSDITPDIVVEIDPVTNNIEDKFQDIPTLKNVPFICLAQYTPGLINIYPGPLFINGVPENVAYQWLAGFWTDKGHIKCFGGSVAHLAFATAEFIGADVIAFVGQDLSYSGGRIHTTGYSDDLDRALIEKKGSMMQGLPGAVSVRNIFNEEVFAIRQFLTFKTSFENRIKDFNGTVIHATEGGLPIDGAVNMRLADFIDEYCNSLPYIDTFSALLGVQSSMGYDLDGLIAEVEGVRTKFKEITKTSKQILKYIKVIKKLKGDGNEDSVQLNNTLNKIETLTGQVGHPLLNLIAGYHYGLELYLKKQEVQEIDDIKDKWEMLDKQLERGQIYYSELINAISLFNSQLDSLVSALHLEKKADLVLNDESMELVERYYNTGIIYKKAGMTAQAVKYLEKIGELQTPNSELLLTVTGLYMQQFRFYEAKEILKTAANSQVTSASKKAKGREQAEKIKKLFKKCDDKIKVWENRKKEMSKLIENAEINYGGHLESGYFYFRLKDYERAEKAYQKAINGKETLFAAYYGLAHVYLAKEDGEKAVEAFEKAIEADPKNPLPFRDLGMMAYQNNNIESAELFFTRAIELAPQAIELYKLLCDLYVGQSEVQKAISLYEDALLANPDDPVIQQELVTLYQLLISRTGTA